MPFLLCSAPKCFFFWHVFLNLLALANGENSYQPKVITVESHPARRLLGSISLPKGSPWCDGMPTYWLVGHQGDDETPWCLVPSKADDTSSSVNHDYSNATFTRPRKAVLDVNDAMNAIDGKSRIDRHSCLALDVNYDGLLDIICLVGADKGTGRGFNEVYLTTKAGNLVKVLEGHGLQKYPSMRSRLIVSLKGADGSQLVFIATKGIPRRDHKTNVHRMFRLTNSTEKSPVHGYNQSFFFEEVKGTVWQRNSIVACLLKVDLNQDGIDDILICNDKSATLMFLQNPDSSWTNLPASGTWSQNWHNARFADITGDGFPDLIVVGWNASIRIFQGSPTYPHFDFDNHPYYERFLPYSATDVEVLDVNGDGLIDLYVVQVDVTKNATNYCFNGFFKPKYWWGFPSPQSPVNYTPPLDNAHDLLLLGKTRVANFSAEDLFDEVFMNHAKPGCGFFLERFGSNRTLILGQGNHAQPGHNLLLQW